MTLESAVSDIQLLGSPEQVRLAQKFADEFAATGEAPLNELLGVLRRDLRLELSLERVPSTVKYLRVIQNEKPKE